MANAEKVLYAAGNPHVVGRNGVAYAATPLQSAYTELDRENARLLGLLAVTRGQVRDAIARAEGAENRAFWLSLALGVYVMGTLLGMAYYFVR